MSRSRARFSISLADAPGQPADPSDQFRVGLGRDLRDQRRPVLDARRSAAARIAAWMLVRSSPSTNAIACAWPIPAYSRVSSTVSLLAKALAPTTMNKSP